jgi:hypothetical protein
MGRLEVPEAAGKASISWQQPEFAIRDWTTANL